MALMISVFVLLTGSLVDGFVSNAIKDNAMDSASEIVTQVNNNLSTYINDIIGVSDYVRELSRTTSNLSASQIQTRLEALISSRDDVVSITVFDMDGNAIISTEPTIRMAGNEIFSELWFRRAAGGEGDFFFTGPHRSSTRNADLVISYSTVISYGDINREATPSVLLIDLNFNSVEELLESAHLSATGYLYIISNDGDIVYHPKERLLEEGTVEEDLESIRRNVFGSYTSTFDGRERLTIIQTVEKTRWRIVGIAFMDELLEPLKPFRISLYVLMVIFILIAILLSRAIALHITRPLRMLELDMRKVQDGDFSISETQGESKEVESLSHSFLLMVQRIEELMEEVERRGVSIGFVTLHVGLGTFRPVKEEEITDHDMHSEYCIIPQETADLINRTKAAGGRVICVGTTSCRTLESWAGEDGHMEAKAGWTNIFIYPGYRFKVMDALITNFHLPESTLIMLVSALAGREHILAAYNEAVKERYRFFSFGDAMFIR